MSTRFDEIEEVEESKLEKINTSKVNIIINEKEWVIPYGIKYKMLVKQPDNALSKMYDEKNELIVNLRVPTNEYKDEDLQELIRWSNLSNFDDDYFRNLALYMKLNEKIERTIVFTKAYIRLNKKINTKADYIDIELIVNQRGDKFSSVTFGEKLEDTLKEAKEREKNPPKLNVIVPVVEPSMVEGLNKRIDKYIIHKFLDEVFESSSLSFESIDDRDKKAKELLELGYRLTRSYEDSSMQVIYLPGVKSDYTVYNIDEYEKRNVTIIILDKDTKNELGRETGYLDIPESRTYTYNLSDFIKKLGYLCKINNGTYEIYKGIYACKSESYTVEKYEIDKHMAISKVYEKLKNISINTPPIFDNIKYTVTIYSSLTMEERLFVTTIYTEASVNGELEWKSVAYTIINRLKNPRDVWYNKKSITEIVTQDWQYSGVHKKDDNYIAAQSYFDNRDGTNKIIEGIIKSTIPIYRGIDTNDNTNNSVYFYSPRSMKPANTVPDWVDSTVEEVIIDGINQDNFRFYRFKN